MDMAVKSALDVLLPEPDRAAYLEACRRRLPVVEQLVERLASYDLVSVRVFAEGIAPSARVTVDVQRWIDGGFIADYGTTVRISRLGPLFTVQHRFAVQNRHPHATEPSLSGSDGFGFIAEQQAVHEEISAVLEGGGLTELTAWDLDESIDELRGTRWHTVTCRPTVRLALFEDLFELLEPPRPER
ncbi:hypothetical protein ENSA5_58560 [Enhygromyxa salina]|uniref:Uncharacterized protein n=1 Tax=Enhygromyxa salina TaxID=215803 RepID=A0A2S9XE31_9BACT|nr:hypothetical protein [Enhygromyxa salina]PRP91119.1 hypothetical protein ENSA5_58560 [Enhygromyxa salina]